MREVLSHLVHFLAALTIMMAVLLASTDIHELHMAWTILLGPVLMLLQAMFVTGLAMIVSSASVRFRDLRDIVANLLQLGFCGTPILYLIENIQSRALRALLRLNPMTPFVVSYQDIF